MLVVEIAKIRRAYFQQKQAIKTISCELKVSRKAIRPDATEVRYERSVQPMPKIGPLRKRLEELLLAQRFADK